MSDFFSIATEGFEGPLDTLLNLIEARKLSISEVALAQVCDAYVSYIEALPEMPLGETAQFILVASTLLLIKSRSLLPLLELSEEERESVEELERRLARLRVIRKASRLLGREWGRRSLLFPRRSPMRPSVFAPAEASIESLFLAARRLLRVLPRPEALAQVVVAPALRLEDVVVDLRRRLTSALRTRFSELTGGASRNDTIVYFLAMLELVRSGSASVTQEKLFSDIEIELEGAVGAPRYGA